MQSDVSALKLALSTILATQQFLALAVTPQPCAYLAKMAGGLALGSSEMRPRLIQI